MRLTSLLKRPAFVLALSLCAASLVCEAMLAHAERATLAAHQARWNCLAEETAKVPRCVALTKLGPREDADFCGEAVVRCRARGFEDDMADAYGRRNLWFGMAIKLRIALFAAAVGSLAWVGIVRPIRWRLRSD